MTTAGRIAQNTLAITFAEVFGTLVSFIFVALLARYLGPDSFGIYAFAGSFTYLFHMGIDLGMNAIVVREVSRDRERSNFYFANTLAIELLSSAVTIAAIWLIILLLGYDLETRVVVVLFAIILGADSVNWLILSSFNAYEDRVHEAYVRIFGKTSYFLLGLVGVLLHLGLVEIVILLLVASVIRNIYGYRLMARSLFRPSLSVETGSWLPIITMSLPFALGWLFYDLYFNIDMTMLSLFKGPEAVAYYSVAYRFISLTMILPQAFAGSIWPLLSRHFTQSPERLPLLYQKSVQYLLMLSIPAAIGISLLAGKIIPLIFGSQYLESIFTLQIIIFVIIFLFIDYINILTMGAMNKPHLAVVSLVVCLVSNVLMNLVLIPRFSYVGAAVSTILTEVILFVEYAVLLSKNGIRVPYARMAVKPGIAGLVMLGGIYLLMHMMDGLPGFFQVGIAIPLGVLIYGASLVLTGSLSEEDWKIIRDIIGERLMRFRS
jgi:O-antigen/teichoic acid export membrane protein